MLHGSWAGKKTWQFILNTLLGKLVTRLHRVTFSIMLSNGRYPNFNLSQSIF